MIIANIVNTDTSETFYISEDEGRINDNGTIRHYMPYLKKFSPVQRRLDSEYGGMIRLSGEGSITVGPDSLNWPPPLKLIISIKDVDQTGIVTSLFNCTGYLSQIQEQGNTYTLYEKEYDVDLLDDAPDWPDEGTPEQENRVYPLAIGTVSCEQVIRIGNDTTEAYYHKAGITGTDPTRATGDYDVFDSGFQREKYGVGTGTIIDSSTYFKSVLSSDGLTLNPPLTDFRISGTNSNITTLLDLFTWAVSRINIALSTSYTLISTNARNPSPDINYFVTEQQNIFDFLSKISAWCTHLFYIDEENEEIVLVDMMTNNGTLELSDSNGLVPKYLNRTYNYPQPLKSITTNWVYYSVEINEEGNRVFKQNEQSQSIITDNLNGIEESIECFDNDIDNIILSLINIGRILQYPRVKVEVPMKDGNINPGLSISFTDSRLKQISDIHMRVNLVQYIPTRPNYKITVEGYAYG